MPKGKRPTYSAEFKAETLRLVRTSGRTQKEIAKDLGVSDRQIRRWQHKEPLEGMPRLALSTWERARLRQLERENRVLREEQEILRKAAAFFARETR